MILVVGSTGDLGGRVVQQLRNRGHEVRCLVRPQTDDAGLRTQGAQIARGDLTDPASLRPACLGVDTVRRQRDGNREAIDRSRRAVDPGGR